MSSDANGATEVLSLLLLSEAKSYIFCMYSSGIYTCICIVGASFIVKIFYFLLKRFEKLI